MSKVTLYALGTRGSYPVEGKDFEVFGGQTSCFVLRIDNHALVIDCGTGFYDAKDLLDGCKKVDVILTHLHYDHIMGLLKGSVFPAGVEITIYGDAGDRYGHDILEQFIKPPFWPIQPKYRLESVSDKKIILSEEVTVEYYPMGDKVHPNGVAFVFIHIGDKTICMLYDCEKLDEIFEQKIEACDLLVFDGMYSDEEYPGYIGWGHSTWQEGCRMAKRRNVKALWVTHHAPERTDAELIAMEQQAHEIYEKAHFARAGEKIEF